MRDLESRPPDDLYADPDTGGAVSRRHFRALFLSDFHLGTIGCKAATLLDFLRHHDAEVTYLVGDIFDNWRPLGAHWADEHDQVLRLLLDRARAGQRMVYIPGNHDDFFRRYLGRYFAELEIARHTWHVTGSGLRLLVTHGDGCDVFAYRLPFLSKAGSWFEAAVRQATWSVNRVLGRMWRDPWDGLDVALSRVNGAIRSHDRFEERLSRLALSQAADGIVCGHFHQAALHRDHGVIYANCGDWVESCTAVAEHADGALELIRWQDSASFTATGDHVEPELEAAT